MGMFALTAVRVAVATATSFLAACGGPDSGREGAPSDSVHESEGFSKTILATSVPSSLQSALVERRFELPEGFMESGYAPPGSAEETLANAGMVFVPGTMARFDESKERLEVICATDQVWVVEALMDLWGQFDLEAETKRSRKIEDKLASIVIPSIRFEETPFSKALAILEQESVLHDPAPQDSAGRGIRIVHELPDSKGGDGEGRGNENLANAQEPRISLILDQVPLRIAIRYASIQARYVYSIDGSAVRIRHLDDRSDKTVTRAFLVPPGLFEFLKRWSSQIPLDPFSVTGGNGAEVPMPPAPWMDSGAVHVLSQSLDTLDVPRGVLVLSAAPAMMGRVETLLEPLAYYEPSIEWRKAREEEYERKLDAIFFSRVSFEFEPLWLVLESLRIRSRLLDHESRIWDRGVRIGFEGDFTSDGPYDPFVPTGNPPLDQSLSFDMADVSLRAVFERICRELGCRFEVGESGLKIVPGS